MVKQAAVKKVWKEMQESDVIENDDDPPTDMENEQLQTQAGTSQKTQQQSTAKGTPAPKKRIRGDDDDSEEGQDGYDLTEILRSFELPKGQLEFSFEELCKATSMSMTKVRLTGWMLVLCKLVETQTESALSAADNHRKHIEKLEKHVGKLKLKNTKLSNTIEQ